MIFIIKMKLLTAVLLLGVCFSCTQKIHTPERKIAVLMNGLIDNKFTIIFTRVHITGGFNMGIKLNRFTYLKRMIMIFISTL
jgi:hypothetical protein